MAFTAVQTSTQVTPSSQTVSNTINPTVKNNMVVVLLSTGAVTETCASVTDNLSNPYTLLGPFTVGTVRTAYMAYGTQVNAGASVVTAYYSGTVAKRMGVDEYGLEGFYQMKFDAYSYATSTGGSALIAGTLTPNTSGELIVSMLTNAGTAVNYTGGAGFTLYNGANPVTLRSQYKLSGGTSETAPGTMSGTNAWIDVALAFSSVPQSAMLVNFI